MQGSDEKLREVAKEGEIKVGRNVTEKMRNVRRRRECSREKGVEKRMTNGGMNRSRGGKREILRPKRTEKCPIKRRL